MTLGRRMVVAGMAGLAGSLAFPRIGEATPVSRGVVARHGRLQVRGNHIVGEHGRPVTLRGMSLFWSQWQGQYYNADAVRWLCSDWKIDVVRAAMAVDSGGYLANPAAELAKVEAVIDAAVANDIYVIIDWHAHQPYPEQAAAFFARIAGKYGALPNLIYEPYNEPLVEHGWADVLKPYHAAVLTAIRRVDQRNLVVAGTRSWSQDVDEAAADPLADPNLAYTLHFYAATHKQALRDKAAAAMAKGAALFVTEYGTTRADGDGVIDATETGVWWDFLEQHHIGYVNWSVADKAELSAALKPGAGPRGKWGEAMLTSSGKLVRKRLRTMA
ncbi:glycoside hydrolase family 5 protein [Sphingomonas qomolangmaensis]|uniref:Glycoside hydrolase family 5 protein n=1 Tax=Sphingomonas qomolangmaensis TaxID=2918765 RepID=A0ABY5L9N8_9SPHN|nr:glycoside hydrolase family 5 protein [Sphingomonas qomolangmaensis]UUL82485.1 glycoside hydrolase family 5 protein [Sphingomonas qomolangmaensis]